MNRYLIMCRSLTYAQRSKRLLEHYGINSAVVKAPQSITDGGCGYALSLYRNFDRAVLLLKSSNMLRGEIYKAEKDGEFQEMLI